jgi:hypothetical protein
LVSEYTLDGYTPTTTPMKDLTIPPSSQIEAITEDRPKALVAHREREVFLAGDRSCGKDRRS